MKKVVFCCFASVLLNAQSIDISKFYYRDYLDFGQNKGAFSGGNSGNTASNGVTLTGKDGTQVSVPNVPNFSASSNYGSLTSVGRGFAVTANHVNSFTPDYDKTGDYRKFGLTIYNISGNSVGDDVSNPYGRDEKFTRFDKYVVEGQVDMLDFANSIDIKDTTQEDVNIADFKTQLKDFAKDNEGNVYIYQTGSGSITLRNPYSGPSVNSNKNGETRGGGFGTLGKDSMQYGCLVQSGEDCDSRGMWFYYHPNIDFNNRITSGDSGSGIYAYDETNEKWVLLGVTSMAWGARSSISVVSNKDFQNYQQQFEQNISLNPKSQDTAGANTWILKGKNLTYQGCTPQQTHTLQQNKDIIFSGNGTITIQVQDNIQLNQYKVGYGGFVFTADKSASTDKPTIYKFTTNGGKQSNGKIYGFDGSGLDIGENVKVEWGLGFISGKNGENDALHKVGKGTLEIKTGENAEQGYLRVGDGKVIFNTEHQVFKGVYLTSGRGELALKKAEALGATSATTINSGATSATSYTLAQENTNNMGFYFGTGGGKLDLAGNSLVLNTIAANDSKAIITNSNTSLVDLEIQGLGYDTDNKKTDKKANTIIHASIGDNTNGASSTNGANLNLIYKGEKTPTNPSLRANEVSAAIQESSKAHLIFDGHINIKGELKAENGNIVLQGHPTTHATISDETIREQIKKAESGTSAAMPDYMDLSKPSNLNQPDWDSRNFNIEKGISLTNATLTVGKAAHLDANITANETSQINFGGKHFIDERDGKNVIGSGFSYQQGVTSGDLTNETYKDSSYSGTIKANGTTITSKFFDFAPNLQLSNNASLKATNLTLNTNSKLNLSGNSSAQIDNLIIKELSNLDGKITLNDSSKFEVKESFTFDNSNLNLDTLKTASNITLPTEYNLYAFNGSKITAKDFQNTNANAEFVLDNSTFNATNGVNFQSANLDLNLSNSSTMSINSFKSTGETSLIIKQGSTLKTTGDMSFDKATIKLANDKSNLSANNLTLNEKSSIILDDKATLTLENALSSKDLTLTLTNESKFNAKTLTASGVLNLNIDANSSIKFSTLNLKNGDLQNISQNVAIEKLNLTDSTANLELLNGQIPKTIDLKTNSTLRLNELNLNTNGLTLTSDDNSKAHIQRLIYDAKSTQANGTSKIPQSNLVVSELFKLDNVGKNLGTNSEQDKLDKDLLTLEFSKNLELKNGAKLEVSFADIVKKDNVELKIGEYYKVFTATSLISNGVNMSLNFERDTGLFVEGKFEQNSFLVKFLTDNPKTFVNLHSRVNPQCLPLLDILLQHNQNDESINKTLMGDEKALNTRLAQIDTSLKTIANADSAALKTLPLLQKQEINARIQQNRFTTAKFALAKITNPAQKSDIVPTLLYLDENERQNRAWSGASASFFGNGSDKFSLQSVSIGYDRKLFGDEFLLGILASLTNTQLSSDETSLNPKIYTLALYSDALFRQGELQNELSFSLLNGDKGFESENGSYKSFYGFFESIYKVQTAFLPQNIKPIVLGRVNLRHFDEFSTATYKQKADDDISVDLGVGVEWLWQRESGFYSASFVAERDIYHSQKERLMSLTGAQKFVAYEMNEPSFSYQLYLAGLESFKSGIYLRYGLSGFVNSKAYKGFKADVQVGYKF